VAGFSNGDAISNEALMIRDIFRSWGYEAEIFSEQKRILPELRHEASDVSTCKDSLGAEDIVLLHLSIGSPLNEVFSSLPCQKAIIYHNVTPPEFFAGLQEQIANLLRKGREQVKQLAGVADVVMADSQFNADELKEMGYQNVQVLPLILDLDKLRSKPGRAYMKKYGDGLKNILFVGRCVPNKRIEDALASFYYFQKYVEPNSRFIHVGSHAGTEQYHALLLTHQREMQLKNVEMPGAIHQEDLNACFRVADLFLCMSEHEGFCIPLMEAMINNVPVLAYEAAAIPETLDGAGVLFKEKEHDLVAEMMGKMIHDTSFRTAILQGQKERLERFENRALDKELKQHLSPLIGS